MFVFQPVLPAPTRCRRGSRSASRARPTAWPTRRARWCASARRITSGRPWTAPLRRAHVMTPISFHWDEIITELTCPSPASLLPLLLHLLFRKQILKCFYLFLLWIVLKSGNITYKNWIWSMRRCPKNLQLDRFPPNDGGGGASCLSVCPGIFLFLELRIDDIALQSRSDNIHGGPVTALMIQ